LPFFSFVINNYSGYRSWTLDSSKTIAFYGNGPSRKKIAPNTRRSHGLVNIAGSDHRMSFALSATGDSETVRTKGERAAELQAISCQVLDQPQFGMVLAA
jgi:hypothetical protein